MAKPYQPLIEDGDLRIRKAIEKLRRRTRLQKQAVVRRLIMHGIENSEALFPEMGRKA